tara:strand:+ start:232 stop:594 length:363 start_codon:yes stop_codon:yes gene_type:complete
MPSQRKRIGFLPRSEVQLIIDQICKSNKLSQSKVTGILVEEALISRGVLNSSINNKSYKIDYNTNKSLLINKDYLNSEEYKINDNFNLNEDSIKDEVQMINDFIEFKFFKNIMNKNKNKL